MTRPNCGRRTRLALLALAMALVVGGELALFWIDWRIGLAFLAMQLGEGLSSHVGARRRAAMDRAAPRVGPRA